MTDPYKIKSIGDGTEPSKDWHLTSEKMMKELIKEKFLQNERLRDKLVYDGYSSYYEMTTDKKWATGVRLSNDGKLVNKALLTGGNKTGLLVAEVKSELRRELGLSERSLGKARATEISNHAVPSPTQAETEPTLPAGSNMI